MLDELVADNPFYVLGLKHDCAPREVEREGQRLLSMLALELKESLTYPTPVGERKRTPEKVRMAMAELRDPAKRLVHEVLARLPPVGPPHGPEPSHEEVPGWSRAQVVLGLGPKRGPKKGGPR
jgi:hypothetical protein